MLPPNKKKHPLSHVRGAVKKPPSIFKDIVQIGGREVNPISKKSKEMIFWQKLEREVITKHIVTNRKHSILYDLLIYMAQPRDSVSFCLYPWPSDSNKDNRECKLKA